MDNRVTVSVVVATYNPQWEKLCETLLSIIEQKEISMEIIIADDGSAYNYFKEVQEFFGKFKFFNYILIPHDHNQGTCKNVLDGVRRASGKYVKFLSPGDLLYKCSTIREWLDYMLRTESDISFGTAIYYHKNGENILIDQVKNCPRNLYIYKKQKSLSSIKENYLLMNDLILGASLLIRTSLAKTYLELIKDHVRYGEDNMYRLMIADNIRITIFNNNVIWYEYGVGVSTGKEDKWKALLKADFDNTTILLKKRLDKKSRFGRKYFKLLCIESGKKRAYFKYFFFPRTIVWKIVQKYFPQKTPTDTDFSFYNYIIKMKDEVV